MTVKDLRSRIAAAVVVVCLFAVGGWVFAQDKQAAPAAAAPAAPASPPSNPDPAGTATGGITDVTAKTTGTPTPQEIADFAGWGWAAYAAYDWTEAFRKGLVGRVEYRHDSANEKVFAIRAPGYVPTGKATFRQVRPRTRSASTSITSSFEGE
jgi:hypothetical protein